MWNFPPFLDFASYITRLDVVSEFIIIDNDSSRTPDHRFWRLPKVRRLDFGKNMKVNPSWNIGADLSSSPILCMMNDDLIFDIRVLMKISEFLTSDKGAVGLCTGREDLGQTPVTTGEIEFEPYIGQNPWGFGELMFVHRERWQPIPQGLDIGFGEVYTFDRLFFSGFTNYLITNMLHYHKGNSTMLTIPSDQRQTIFEDEKTKYDVIKKNLMPL